jgi:prevent-host-death family protein
MPKTTKTMKTKARTKMIAAGAFKANCLAIMDEVQAKRQSVVITKRGKPVAKLVPIETDHDDFFGYMKGKMEITGDIVSPIIPLSDWEMLK